MSLKSKLGATKLILFALVGSFVFSAAASAQPDRPGRKVVGDLFKAWLETELQRADQKRRDKERAAKLREERRTEFDLPSTPRRPRIPTETAQPLLTNVRTSLKSYTQNANLLGDELNVAVRSDRSLRPLLAEHYKIQANANLLYKQLETVTDPQVISDSYCELDCSWRNLSYKFKSVSLSPRCRGYITQLDKSCDRLCAALDIDPQFDRDRMLRLMVRGVAYMQTLLDDIEIELYGQPEADRLLGEGRRLQQIIRHDTAIVRDGSYEEVANRFANFVAKWRMFSAKLYGLNNPHIQRRLGRIRSVGENISELLWQTPTVDYQYMNHVSMQMSQQMNNLFDHMTVNELISLPADQQTALLNAASQLKSQCASFCAIVEKKGPLDNLRGQYVSINQRWTQLTPYLTKIESKRIAQCNRQIGFHGEELQIMLRMRQQVNRSQLVQLAAELEVMAGQLNNRIARLDSQYSTRDYRARVNSAAQAFRGHAKTMHQAAAHNRDLARLRTCCNDVIKSWNQLSVIVGSMPKNGISAARFDPVNRSRQETVGIVAEIAAYLSE